MFVGVEVVEGAVAEEVLDVDFVFLHVVEVEPLGVGGGNEEHVDY